MTDGERNLRVVVVEDSPTDAELVARELKKGGDPIEVERVDSASALRAALERGPCDLVISDYNLPGFSGPDALQVVKSYSADIPFILVSGTVGEELAVQTLKSGADDYLLKGNLTRLAASVKAQLQEAEGRRARRRSEHALHRAQAMARLGHVIMRADGSFESWSETLPQLIGVDSAGMPQSTREWLNIVHPDDKQKFREKAIETGATGERFDLEYRLRRADGAWIDVRQVSEPMMPGEPDAEGRVRWFGTLQDVTEQKRAEEALRASEGLKGAVLESSLDCIVTMDHEGKIVEFNPAAERTFGYTREQAHGKSMAELIIPPRLRDAHHRGLAHYLATGEGPVLGKRLELEAIRSDGTEFPIELAITPIKSGATPLFTGFIRDITQRRESDAKIKRLNRVYAVLSGINAAIVHTRDRQELFREVCRIAIDSGRFRMVWFGLLDKEGQRVMPVASAGDVRGFFDAASSAVTHAQPGGLGLTGRAIREMKPMVSNDIQNDPQRTMKEEFRERGINSLAVLPLIIGNEAVGVVNLYAADVGFFDEEEMRLLGELAGDISFALDNIDRQEKLRRLTRVNEMLSSINGAIVRIRDRLELYQEACRIAVETGGLRFAWLCVLDKDEMRLKPVASAGADDGYLDLIRGRLLLRDDAPEGHGMAAKAVREKRALVVNDAQRDPNVLFKEEHAARRIRSIAVLPLSVAGKVVGTFGLHSREVGFFDDREMKLIDEIAGNIAFALDHIDKEEKLERLNRVYAVLSGINGMIVRVRDRDELFREACRIAIELGQFRLVYIGLVDEAAQQIRPVAWAGDHPDLAQRPRPLGPSAPGREGTASQAIRSKRPVVENNIAVDSRTLTYPEEVLKRGYRSVGSFPLVVEDKAVGVLGLFAGEPGYFDAQEIRLLQELASDIAFALEHLEKEEKVRRLTRVQAMLSGINAAIVRIRDRQELFGEACHIAVEAGKLRFVWIGVVDHEAMQLKPVAWAGEEQDFLAAVGPRLSLSEADVQVRSLVAQVVVAGQAMISNDTATDPRIRFKSEHAQRGIRSLAAFPLIVADRVLGVFALHAAEVGFFDADEVRLLSELAGDISFALDHIEKAEKLEYLANYDPLTGLANRTLLHERLGQFVHTSEREQHRLALLILDIERFKAVNDAYGRHAGDALLKQIAERMVRSRADPTRVARLSADHFALVLPRVRSDEQMARRLESRLEEFFAAPYAIAGAELRISAKIGIALFPSDAADPETLLKNAESALKKAKRTGERYVFYAPQMTERVAENLSLENKLRRAVEREEFVLHYQPKVDLERRQVVGAEALIRWQSPELGLVPPGKFIPLLEETGLILQVGSWALRRAALDHRRWAEQKLKVPRVAVNVSQIQLRQRDFVAVVEQAIVEGLAPTAIDLEITESLIMEDVQANIAKLKAVRDLGMKIAIDDFGTGYSSLGYLAQLPVESLKIDRSFIIAMHSDPNATTLVSTIISLARSLRLKVVAEGVETEEQAKLLRLLRCDEMQGYLFSKPLPIDALVELLRKAS
jgi:diguanylate cyclase (GGDEF)-like protein/PAS domain S-box-containing protein